MRPLTFQYYDIPPVLCMLAMVLYIVKFNRLERYERWILVVLAANIFTDVASYILIHMDRGTHVLYNILLPVERTVILLIYAANEYRLARKRIHYVGTVLVWLTVAASTVYLEGFSEFHYVSNIATGLVLATLSYIHLRSVSLNHAGQSVTLLYFGLANMIYFTLMISAMSALPLAQRIDEGFAGSIFSVNVAAYAIWCILLIIGILWKKRKN